MGLEWEAGRARYWALHSQKLPRICLEWREWQKEKRNCYIKWTKSCYINFVKLALIDKLNIKR